MLLVDPQTYDVILDENDQEKLQFTLTNADGSVFNANGSVATFIAKRSLDDNISAAVMNISSAVQVTQWDFTQAASGIIVLEFTGANTAGHGGETLLYGLKLVDGTAKVHTPRRGRMIIRKNPTD